MTLLELKKRDGHGAFVRLAAKANTSASYLSQIANGHRVCGLNVAKKLAAADRRISLGDLRPDLFGEPS